jgi:energy-coupling factor transport system ATP-binding protein
VFRSLNLQLRRNAVTGVAARSGGGKTTLATLLAGLQRPTSGSIHWLGSKADEDHLLRSVGYLLQFPERQIFCETVADEIKFGLNRLQLSAIDADIRIRESLRLAGLDSDSFIDRSPFRLSGGEMRKVALASVLALQRPLIIYDEPVAELDWESSRRFVSVVKKVSLSGVTQVVISHDSDFLFEVCDDLILLSEGVAKYAGAKFQLADNPAVFEECGVSVPAVISLCIERSCADYLVHYRISSVAELVEKLQHGA